MRYSLEKKIPNRDFSKSQIPLLTPNCFCRKTQSTFYNKAEVLICIQAFTYILDWNQSQDGRHHTLIGSMRNPLTNHFEVRLLPGQLFRGLNIEEDCSAIYQIYPRIICVYKTCKIKTNVSSSLIISTFNTHVCLQNN